ncbi:MAG: adenosylcobinamide-GDP ribazoletransferase [Pseudomonadota bacterium]|nr:adenosylcobinamide-GDP ribazoletransferase [Pseudomonadota bacterium]
MWRSVLIAGRFLTRLPLPDPGPLSGPDLGRSAPAYPLVGLVLGLLLWGLARLLGEGGSVELSAALVLTVWVWMTGALHLDGLADSADAWIGGLGDRERTLAIMKEPSSGPMAVVVLVLVLLCKWAAIAALIGKGLTASLIWVPTLARAQLLLPFLTTPYVRPRGMGAETVAHLTQRAAWVAIGLTLIGSLLHLGVAALEIGLAGGILFLLWRQAMMSRLGGFTGDTAGALVELTETLALVVAALSL